jgi:hypothetical protein
MLLFCLVHADAEPRVVSAKDEADIISSRLGITVRVSPKLARDLVFVEPHGAGARIQLDSLAEVLDASLIPTKGGFLIERTPKDLKALRSHRSSTRASWLEKTLKDQDRFRRSVPGSPAPAAVASELAREELAWQDVIHGKANRAGFHFATQLLPAQVLMEQLIGRIGIQNLADTPSYQRRVIEDDPVSGAGPLPAHTDLVDSYLAAMQVYEQARPLPAGQLGQMGLSEQFGGWGEPAVRPSKLRLLVASEPAGLILNLEGYDEGGNRVLYAVMTSGPAKDLGSPAAVVREASATPRKVELSASSRDAQVFGSAMEKAAFPEWFKAPDKVEPLN